MTAITDEYMYEMLAKTEQYSILIVKPGPRADLQGNEKIIFERGRRNFALRADGLLPIVCPATEEADINGFGIFNTSTEEAKKIMDEDPAVQAGIFEYTVYPCRSFPGDMLP